MDFADVFRGLPEHHLSDLAAYFERLARRLKARAADMQTAAAMSAWRQAHYAVRRAERPDVQRRVKIERIMELRAAGYSDDEIGAKVALSGRQVRRLIRVALHAARLDHGTAALLLARHHHDNRANGDGPNPPRKLAIAQQAKARPRKQAAALDVDQVVAQARIVHKAGDAFSE